MGTLTGFEITRQNGDYLIHFNMDGGDTIELVATFDQLDLIAEEIDRHLDSDEEDALSGDDDDDEVERPTH